MRLTWLSALPLLLAACNSTPSAVNEGAAPRVADRPTAASDAAAPAALPPPDTARAKAAAPTENLLRQVRQEHNFSQHQGPPDVFKLVFQGPFTLVGNAEFTITDPSGQVIFREILTEPDLEAALVYELKTPAATPAQREDFVNKRLDKFFWDEQFHTPAVAPGARFPAGLPNLDRATWQDLQKRPEAIAFEYLKGKEDRRRIAWSPLKKQIVRVQ